MNGQLTVRNHNARFSIVFQGGHVVAAASPGSAEHPLALAHRQGVIDASQLARLEARRAEYYDDFQLLADVGGLSALQILRLRRQSIAACVARTFVFDQAEFTLSSEITLLVAPNTATHIGGLIYHGARMYLGEQRLQVAVRELGNRFTLRDDRVGELGPFPFGEHEGAAIRALIEGTSVSAIDAIADEPVRRTLRAAIYALGACGILECERTHRFARGTTDPAVRRSQPRLGDGTPMPRRTPTFRTALSDSAALAYKRGREALDAGRLDEAISALARAHELMPDHVDYRCTLAWAQFQRAPDKRAVAGAIRSVLRHALEHGDRPALPQLYLDQLDQLLGNA